GEPPGPHRALELADDGPPPGGPQTVRLRAQVHRLDDAVGRPACEPGRTGLRGRGGHGLTLPTPLRATGRRSPAARPADARARSRTPSVRVPQPGRIHPDEPVS